MVKKEKEEKEVKGFHKKLHIVMQGKVQSKRIFKKEPRQTLHLRRINFLGGEMIE